MWSNDKKEYEVTITKNKEDNSVMAEFAPKEITGFSTIEKNICSIDGTSREFEYVKNHYREDIPKRKKPPVTQDRKRTNIHKMTKDQIINKPNSSSSNKITRRKKNFRLSDKILSGFIIFLFLTAIVLIILPSLQSIDFSLVPALLSPSMLVLYVVIGITAFFGNKFVQLILRLFGIKFRSNKSKNRSTNFSKSYHKHWNPKTRAATIAISVMIMVCFLPILTQSPITQISLDHASKDIDR